MDAPDAAPRFVVDAMLGRLAKWLRLFGYDAVYDPALDDAALARLSVEQGRLLLTRDRELSRRRNLRVIYVRDQSLAGQLAQLDEVCGLRPVAPFSHCLVCNRELAPVPRSEVQGRVPPRVWQTQERFWSCPACGRVYWHGSHVARAIEYAQRWRSARSGSREHTG